MDFTYSDKWGVQKEEYNLYYMRDRYYSSELHRFLSLDKDQGDLYRPSTLNPYAYVGNDPINFIDPSGMVGVEIGSAIKQVLLGDLSGEFTLVGMVARIGSSFFGFDILGDIGDLVDSLIHFDFSLEAFVNLGINTIGLLPVFGVVKNVKYVDKAIDSVKGLGKGAYQLGKRTIGGATKFALKAGVKVADYAKTGYKAASNAVGTGLNKASSFFGASSTKQVASAVEDGLSNSNKIFWGTWNDYEKVTINNRVYAKVGDKLYTHHAIDRIQPSGFRYPHGKAIIQAGGEHGRSVSPTYVQYVLDSTKGILEPDGRYKFISGTLEVITGESKNIVITVKIVGGKKK